MSYPIAYPYFSVAVEHKVSYSDVLEYVARLEGELLEDYKGPLPILIRSLILDRYRAEMERRKCLLQS